jgi:DegV family protein with EDD domain
MIKIVTDTAVSLPPEIVKQYDITLLGGYVYFGDQRYTDYFELTSEQFYQMLAKSHDQPVVVDPKPDAFKVIYRSLLLRHPGVEIISIHCTGELATTVDVARVAAASFPEAHIRIFDTLSVGAAQGLMVWEAAAMAADGASAQAILQRLGTMRDNVPLFFTLDTLNFVARSGRVGPIERLVGNLLDVKPVLTLREGRVELYAQHRSRSRALDALRDMAIEAGRGRPHVRLAVMHADCEADARKLADEVNFVLQADVLLVSALGAGIGAAAGPGALGICWYVPPAEAGEP